MQKKPNSTCCCQPLQHVLLLITHPGLHHFGPGLQGLPADRQLSNTSVAKYDDITWPPPAGAMDWLSPGVLLWHSLHRNHHEHDVVSLTRLDGFRPLVNTPQRFSAVAQPLQQANPHVMPCCAAGPILVLGVAKRIPRISTPAGEQSRLASLLLVGAGLQAMAGAMAALLPPAVLSACQNTAKRCAILIMG